MQTQKCNRGSQDLTIMGVTGLWQAVAPAAKKYSLQELTVNHMFNPDGTKCSEHPFRIGVDASLGLKYFYLCGQNPELRTLFYKLAHLYHTPANILFVFNGPQKPAIKRGKKVVTIPPWLTTYFKDFASAFGFRTHEAAGKAEAELAALNQLGVIDAVWTEDSDVDNDNDKSVLMYSANGLAQESTVALTKGGLLLMALFCGGDYDNGLSRCGWKTTCVLAQHGVGDELLHAATTTMNEDDLTTFLGPWVKHVCDLLTKMGSVVLAYVKPSITFMCANPGPPQALSMLLRTDLERLAFLCKFCFGWSRGGPPIPVHAIESSGTLRKLKNLVYEGVCICNLCGMDRADSDTLGNICPQGPSESSSKSCPVRQGFTCSIQFSVFSSQCKDAASGQVLVQHRLEIDTTPLVLPAKRGVAQVLSMPDGVPQAGLFADSAPSTHPAPSTHWVWMPDPVVRFALPGLLATGLMKHDTEEPSHSAHQRPSHGKEMIELTDSDSETEREIIELTDSNSKTERKNSSSGGHTFDLGVIELTDSE
ncbi:PIN domain-like protein [Pisolithus orientalis]|uniref:PIN domain-like protein n=1 Tax=Pisolithus orientalis TaxID=936130 RepID=UPI002223FFB6|nr:PIN domain-like protein [Pisolithus orientalis]KAI6028392.1 PIN domain-like protein [Pisolithus orientalis]